MSNRRIPIIDGEFYHIYNRGNSKQKIFLEKEDYDYFIKFPKKIPKNLIRLFYKFSSV